MYILHRLSLQYGGQQLMFVFQLCALYQTKRKVFRTDIRQKGSDVLQFLPHHTQFCSNCNYEAQRTGVLVFARLLCQQLQSSNTVQPVSPSRTWNGSAMTHKQGDVLILPQFSHPYVNFGKAYIFFKMWTYKFHITHHITDTDTDTYWYLSKQTNIYSVLSTKNIFYRQLSFSKSAACFGLFTNHHLAGAYKNTLGNRHLDITDTLLFKNVGRFHPFTGHEGP